MGDAGGHWALQPRAFVAVRPPVPVRVRDRGRWLPGTLEQWRKVGGRWQGHVIFTDGPGVYRTGWRDRAHPPAGRDPR